MAFGPYALQYMRGGASGNTGIGINALNQTDGNNNIGIGINTGVVNKGSNNTIIGSYSGAVSVVDNGSNLTFIGYGAGNPSYGTLAGLANATAIGYMAQVRASNTLILGGTGSNAVNVGIGTTTPQAALDVNGNARIAGNLAISGSGSLTLPDGTVLSSSNTLNSVMSSGTNNQLPNQVLSSTNSFSPPLYAHTGCFEDFFLPVLQALLGVWAAAQARESRHKLGLRFSCRPALPRSVDFFDSTYTILPVVEAGFCISCFEVNVAAKIAPDGDRKPFEGIKRFICERWAHVVCIYSPPGASFRPWRYERSESVTMRRLPRCLPRFRMTIDSTLRSEIN